MTPHNDATPYWYKPDGTLRRDLYTPEELGRIEEHYEAVSKSEQSERAEIDALQTKLERTKDVDECIDIMDDIRELKIEIMATGTWATFSPIPEPGCMKDGWE